MTQVSESIGMRSYRIFARGLQAILLPILAKKERLEGGRAAIQGLKRLPEDPRKTRVWFHAASVGELESLWPLIEKAASAPGYQCLITVFSSSAHNHLHRNSKRLPAEALLFAGYSPFEGGWWNALLDAKPNLFVTAKYEAWPELWHSLGRMGIPLAIVGAKHRSSLKAARAVLRTFRGCLPRLHLVTFDRRNVEALERAFPDAKIHIDSDPRWDRVFERAGREQPRVAEIAQRFADLPRPWIILGQVWPADLDEFRRHQLMSATGTFWFVPHNVDPASVKALEIRIREMELTPVRTSDGAHLRPAGRLAVLVDEMGFLAELYRLGDWAYVGGGFGAGVHSTIEPAVAGLKVASGPKGAEKFDEIPWLAERKVLTVLRDPKDWDQFKSGLGVAMSGAREKISLLVSQHRGAAERIWRLLATPANQ